MESIGLIWDYVYSTGKLYFFFIHLALLVLGIHFIRQNVSQSERNRRVDGRKRKHNSQKFISEEKLLGTEENGNSSVKPAQFLSHVRRNDRLNEPAGYGTDWAGEVLAWLCRYPFVVDVELYKTNILSVLNRRLQRKNISNMNPVQSFIGVAIVSKANLQLVDFPLPPFKVENVKIYSSDCENQLYLKLCLKPYDLDVKLLSIEVGRIIETDVKIKGLNTQMPIVLLQRFRKCTSEQGLADNSVIEIMTLLHNVFSLMIICLCANEDRLKPFYSFQADTDLHESQIEVTEQNDENINPDEVKGAIVASFRDAINLADSKSKSEMDNRLINKNDMNTQQRPSPVEDVDQRKDIPSKHVIVTDLDKALAEAGQTSQVTNVIENSSDRELNDDSSLDTISIPEINILTATPVMEKRNNTKEMAEEKEEAKEDVTAAVAVSDNSRTNISNKVKLDLNGNGSFQKLSSRPKSMINVSQNDKYKTGTADDMAIEKEDLFNRQGPTRHSLHSTSRSFKSTGNLKSDGNSLKSTPSQVSLNSSLGYSPNKYSALIIETEVDNVKRYCHIPPAMARKGDYDHSGQKLHVYNDHIFVATHFSGSPFLCSVCNLPLARRIGKQGYQCRDKGHDVRVTPHSHQNVTCVRSGVAYPRFIHVDNDTDCRFVVHKRCHYLIPTFCPNSTLPSLNIEYIGSTDV